MTCPLRALWRCEDHGQSLALTPVKVSIRYRTGPNSHLIPRPSGSSDNDGSLFVSAYRGIGSETVRRPVVIAGRDPDKAMAGSWLHTRSPWRSSLGSGLRMLPAVSPPRRLMAKDLRGFWKAKEAPVRTMALDRRAAAFKVRKKKAKKAKAPWKPVISLDDSFFKSLKWRQLRYLVLRNTGGLCQSCGAGAKDGVRIHVDHIKPRCTHPELSLCLDNLQVLCEDCNVGKGSWDDTDWRIKMR